MAEFKFVGHFAELFGKREAEISLESSIKLRDIMKVEFSEERAIVLINQQPGNFDSLIRDEDRVVIIPIVSGG